MSAVYSSSEVARVLATQAALFLAALLLATAAHKMLRWRSMQAVASDFGGMPPALAGPALALMSCLEVLAGGMLVLETSRGIGALLAGGIFGLYGLLLWRAIATGRRDLDCGCSFGRSKRSLSAFDIIRSLGLTGLALAIAWTSWIAGTAAMVPSQALGATALLLLYGAVEQVVTLTPLRSGELL